MRAVPPTPGADELIAALWPTLEEHECAVVLGACIQLIAVIIADTVEDDDNAAVTQMATAVGTDVEQLVLRVRCAGRA